MTSAEDLEEGKVAAVLDLAILVAVVELDVFDTSLVEGLLPGPLEGLSPSLVSEPIADEICITSIDQNRDFLQDAWYKAVEWLHPIALEEEIPIDIKVAAVIATDFNT